MIALDRTVSFLSRIEVVSFLAGLAWAFFWGVT
jgi:hypothetical protein